MIALVTGHCGFIGRHITAHLQSHGWTVVGVDVNHPDAPQDALDFFRYDKRTFDLAIHCAAIVGGRATIDGNPLAVATNAGLDAWYFHWLVRTGTPHAVYYSSSAAYPVWLQHREYSRPLKERDINPLTPEIGDQTYGDMKLQGEKLAAIAREHGVDIKVFRPFSGYGEDQSLDYPFPAFVRRAVCREDAFTIWGDGASTRDWIHVDDIVAATMAALERNVTEPVNLCTGFATSFDTLAELVCRRVGYRPEFHHIAGKPQGVMHRVGDPSRLKAFYTPQVTLSEGVSRAIKAQRTLVV